MRNSKVFTSIISASFIAALSIALTACSDNSSTGVEPAYTPIQGSTALKIKNFSQQCQSGLSAPINDAYIATDMPLDAPLLSATVITGPDSAEVVVGDFYMTCSDDIDSVEASVSGDSLHLKTTIRINYPQADCICPKRLSFKVESSALPKRINYLFLNGEEIIQFTTGTEAID